MTYSDFQAFIAGLPARLAELPRRAQIAYGASCCSRMIPNYEAFSAEVVWGDPQALHRAMGLAWVAAIQNKTPAADLDEMVEKVVANSPDTENFRSLLTSAALDAAVAASELLQFLKDSQVMHLVTIATLSRDTIYMACELGWNEKNSASPIPADLLFGNELQRHENDLEMLKTNHNAGSSFYEHFRGMVFSASRSNLEVSAAP